MRKRINKVALASSENYQRSRELHIEHLERKHSENIKYLGELGISYRTVHIFGKEVTISKEELRIHKTLITWK